MDEREQARKIKHRLEIMRPLADGVRLAAPACWASCSCRDPCVPLTVSRWGVLPIPRLPTAAYSAAECTRCTMARVDFMFVSCVIPGDPAWGTISGMPWATSVTDSGSSRWVGRPTSTGPV